MPRLKPRLRRSLIATHRFFGQAAAVIVVLLALTGLALNHDEDLTFLKGKVRWEPLLDFYGLEPRGEWAHFVAGEHSCASLERGIYVDGRYLTDTQAPLVGAVRYQGFLALASQDRMLIVDPIPTEVKGPLRLIDQMDSASLPGTVLRVGRDTRQQLVVETDAGRYRASDDLLAWDPLEGTEVTWSLASEPTAEQRAAILREYRGEGLPRTRVIADLHSGRIFGRYGPLLMDASAVVLLLLVVTGIMGSGLGRRKRGSD